MEQELFQNVKGFLEKERGCSNVTRFILLKIP